ncbi:helix-turn-helix transcriptional regulator [Clostridium sp.]|uniref:helix-turn-helix domain-containing protein n=1 Tax=Clostridium sp. TaxID=1506 RepID=UPI00257DF200|nr:helix-turn-helix transcriptional regulator [Clostridium sp.]MBS5463848.1 helix-turn-helix transcriptional regulator [Clostridium sp.]
MNERIKELRKVLGLSREEFANKLGLKSRGKIENIELGRTSPDEPFLDLICKTYNINPEWLRTGQGEMFIELSKDEQIEDFIGELLSDEEDSFKRRLISGLAALDENGWTVLEKFLDSIQKKG